MTTPPHNERLHDPELAQRLTSLVEPPSPPKCRCSTYRDRLDIIDFCHANPHMTQTEVAFHFRAQFPSLSQPTISRYLSGEQAIRRYVAKHPERLAFTRPIYVPLSLIEGALQDFVNRTCDDAHTRLPNHRIYEKGYRFDQCHVVPGDTCDDLYCMTRFGELTCRTQQRQAGSCRFQPYHKKDHPARDFSNRPMFGILTDESHPASHTYGRPLGLPTQPCQRCCRPPESDH
ncbi:hypothetical protein FRC12_001668 [Ceratobasidium sp. 428]|nr:hypothetical protein FRC12_001668 [Ceratobasidium sp. 428]